MTSRAEELASRITPETDWYEFHAEPWCMEAAAELRRLAAEVESLKAAAVDVLIHVNGELPTRGWLNDNDKSRAALGALKKAIKETPHG